MPVTGGAAVIGAAICQALARHGAQVYFGDLDGARCAEVADRIRDAGGQARALPGDLVAPGTGQALVDALRAEGSGLDVLVTAAIWIRYAPLTEIDEADANRMITVGLLANLRLLQAAVGLLAQRGGSVVNVTSSVAVRPPPASSSTRRSRAR